MTEPHNEQVNAKATESSVDEPIVDNSPLPSGDISAYKGDKAVLNAVLRAFYESKQGQVLDPPQKGEIETDHFIEVQQVVNSLLQKHPIKDLHGRYLGQFMRVSEHMNKSSNLFKIEKKLNQSKKGVDLKDYPKKKEIQKYYNSKVQNSSKTVLQLVKELLLEMINDKSMYSPLSNDVGRDVYNIVERFK
jgi:hypothetical protein